MENRERDAAVQVVVTWGSSDDEALLRRTAAAGLGVAIDAVTEGRICPECAGTDHGRPVVRVDGRDAGWVSLSRHHEVAVVAWCASTAVGVDVDGVGHHDWVRREARGKCLGTGIAGADHPHLATRLLAAPSGCVAALCVDTDGDWDLVVT